MPSRDKLAEFVQWCGSHIKGDENGEEQAFSSFFHIARLDETAGAG